ncbi:MAG: hypothetical protein LQ340_007970 [Diploschistes diacapsis]|nr:MAG: hypothetical protein LQ340_007970 [Diploschistes diacapsis]
MESLLSHSFDYLSSNDSTKIRKGLRQLEGLLAQICLSQSGLTSSPDKRRSIATTQPKDSAPKELAALVNDPAFREFFKLQEGFQWNGMRFSIQESAHRLTGPQLRYDSLAASSDY